ncbi:MAG TPA: ParB/RepB/Spo0J family partition protein [Bacillota bacterium]|nr:ParB/RepB/Spo0J family partition protein [Bacillota bacterium]HOK69484.1 ParB/RepB/Spo0J family partition protein [Bacillota bacterium]HPP85686.1 ParB/RepB/Spo0J family partition protein [Bacillota bacterium]
MIKKGLGRGLDALLYDNTVESSNGGITMLKISDIEPNREQARKTFDETALSELADSILLHGLVQPIVVRKKENGFYEIIAGERRWRACKMAGLSEIPAIVKDVGDLNASELSLIENLQRENLNPVEEANGYRELIEKYGLTQEEAAKRVGKSRVAVANLLRILKLPQAVLTLVEKNELSYGHARALIPLCDHMSDDEILAHAKKIASSGMSVRDTERLAKNLLENKKAINKEESIIEKSYYKALENKASSALGRRVAIKQSSDGKGSVQLAYSSSDDLEQLLKKLCGADFFEESSDE